MAKRLLLPNGLSIASVILFHAAGWGLTAMFAWPHRYLPVTSPNYDQAGSASYYALRLVEQLIIFAISAFIFVSGFFIAFTAGRDRTGLGRYRQVTCERRFGLVLPSSHSEVN